MSNISIIINGTRYDAVNLTGSDWCDACDLLELCNAYDCVSTDLCYAIFGVYKVFKKSDKKFEP